MTFRTDQNFRARPVLHASDVQDNVKNKSQRHATVGSLDSARLKRTNRQHAAIGTRKFRVQPATEKRMKKEKKRRSAFITAEPSL